MSKERAGISSVRNWVARIEFTPRQETEIQEPLIKLRPDADSDEIKAFLQEICYECGSFHNQLKKGPPPRKSEVAAEITEIRSLVDDPEALLKAHHIASDVVQEQLRHALWRLGSQISNLTRDGGPETSEGQQILDLLRPKDEASDDLQEALKKNRRKGHVSTGQYARWWIGDLYDIYTKFTGALPGRITRRRPDDSPDARLMLEEAPDGQSQHDWDNQPDSKEEFPFAEWVCAIAKMIGHEDQVTPFMVRDVVRLRKIVPTD